jgi:hypothetical protein
MNKKLWGVLAGVCTLAVGAICASAQTQEVKEKPRMYSYVAFWAIPRAQWADYAKQAASEEKTMQKAIADGSLVGYGEDQNLIHQPDGFTHDGWFSSMSEAGLLNVLDQFYKSGSTTSAVDISATRHADAMFVSRYYDWHSGSWRGLYSEASMYTLKKDAPDNAYDLVCKNLFVPLLEKLLADGTIVEYEIDTEAIHTEAPGTLWVDYITANAEGLDKVSAAVREAAKADALGVAGFGLMIDFKEHRDYLSRTDATYK